MRTRIFKALALAAALIAPTFLVNPALAGDAKPFRIHFAGGFIQNIEQTQLDPMGMPTGTEARSLALVKGRGTFGRVDIMAFSVNGPPISNKQCPDSAPDKASDIVENNLVLTFNDLSLLYGNGTGIVCVNFSDPSVAPVVEVDGTWNGGTGRFADAGGTWSIRFHFFEPVGDATQFAAEAGVIEGYLTGLGD